MKAIVSEKLVKNYGITKALDNIDLTIESGEIYGFIGPNGAGKSTFIKVLLNLVFATDGTAKIFGKDVQVESSIIKMDTGYVSSEVRLYEDMTPYDLMKKTLDFHNLKTYDEIDKICLMFEIDKKKKIGEMSLGNKKKVAIACALIHNPKLIILDEPTNGLDPIIQKRLFETLKERNSKGVTIFISSHNLTEIQEYCTKVAFIKQGKIIAIQDLTKEYKQLKIITLTYGNTNIKISEILDSKIIEEKSGCIKFVYEKDINTLMKILTNFNIKDILIENSSLENSFLSYYEGGDKDGSI